MVQLPRDFKEFLQLLNKNNVDYLIVGGYAVAFHGAPRFTGDIDIFVATDEENREKIVKALIDFGFRSLDVVPEDFQDEGRIIQLGVPPMRIDLITSIDGVTWVEAKKEAKVLSVDEERIQILSLKHLIANKKATGRHKDLADIDALTGKEQKISKKPSS